ncbi:helix-turn-helix domain-containing protein, partial [Clostridium tertium]|uniref:helix-turn-helix domain-containing protein n=1 Tax=Clostridium tertium TaxID=1559 RepID=UPI00128FD5A7
KKKAKKKYNEQLKEDGKIGKKEQIEQRRAKIKDLLDKGLSQKEIYLYLNISKRTCINDIKYLKEQGLI